jgi:hypothetical protein
MRSGNRHPIPKRAIVLASLIVSALGFAQQPFPDYFPLEVGNQWVYRSVIGQVFRTVSISGTQPVNGVTYAVMLQNADPPTSALYRNDGAGKIYLYDSMRQQEVLAYDFTNSGPAPSGPVGALGTFASIGNYSGPLGVFNDAYTIQQVAYGTTMSTTFLPYIGQVASSFSLNQGSAGLVPPMVENLVYARINDITVLTTQDWGFGITLDRAVYHLQLGQTGDCELLLLPLAAPSALFYHPCAQVRLTLRLKGSDPVQLSFPTQQLYELKLQDPSGNAIWTLSGTKTYGAGPRNLVVGPGEVNFVELMPLTVSANTVPAALLAPGTYNLSATLLNNVGPSASASIQFVVSQ